MAGTVPLLHGSQGCTAFSLVLMVRHFKETIPIQTTAMSEVSTILGGADHLEEAILNIRNRAKPSLIGICTTALVETRGEDFAGDLAAIRGPLQVVLGERSTTSDPRRTRDRLATVLPQTPLTVIPGAGHVVSSRSRRRRRATCSCCPARCYRRPPTTDWP